MLEAEVEVMFCEDEGRAIKQGMQAASISWERQRSGFSLTASIKNAALPTLGI